MTCVLVSRIVATGLSTDCPGRAGAPKEKRIVATIAARSRSKSYFFFPILFLPFLPRFFFRIFVAQVLFQLTFAMVPPSVCKAQYYTGRADRVTCRHRPGSRCFGPERNP